MIFQEVGKIHYVNETKTGQRIGVNIRRKVVHFDATNDETFKVGDVMVVTATRQEDSPVPDSN